MLLHTTKIALVVVAIFDTGTRFRGSVFRRREKLAPEVYLHAAGAFPLRDFFVICMGEANAINRHYR